MKSSLTTTCLALLALSLPLTAQTKIPSSEKALKSFIDKEILTYSTADNTEYIDSIKMAQRVWISFYKAESEFATLAAGLPLIPDKPLKGTNLKKNITKIKQENIIARYHDFIYKPAMAKDLPQAAADYSNPLLVQMEKLMQDQRDAITAAAEESSGDAAASIAPFSETYLLAAQQQQLLAQLSFYNHMINDWLKLKYRQHEGFTDILKAKEELDKKWLDYLDAMQRIYTKQKTAHSQEQAHRLAISLLLRRLKTLQKQLPFAPEKKEK